MEKLYKWEELTEEQKSKFIYPSQLETMPVEKALDYLELARSHHGEIFEDYIDFKKTLVIKCNVDPEYVFGPDFVEDVHEICQHIMKDKKVSESQLKEIIAEINSSSKKEELMGIKKMLFQLKNIVNSGKGISRKSGR